MNRGERAVYIGTAGVLSPYLARFAERGSAHPAFYLMLATLLLVAVMANITAIRRFAYIHSELRKREVGLDASRRRRRSSPDGFSARGLPRRSRDGGRLRHVTILVEVSHLHRQLAPPRRGHPAP